VKKGFVSLVGAGPGDPELLTLKALKRIQQADLIIYDYLVNTDHLRHAKKGCAILSVGKGFRHKLMSQKIINRRIIREAKRGKHVVRLKGGDPYLFGRGGEEALFLEKNGIPFDVVPGITSAVACANYAGIPLTHREHNSSVTFLTGHRAHDEALDSIDWKRIAALPGTLVIYMGFYNLPVITQKLIANGMRASMPAAVIEWGTLPRQKTCTGTLRDIASRVKSMQFEPPCLIVIGDVVKLRPKLDWFERLSLFKKRVLVTRSQEQLGALSSRLRALGAEAVELPSIRILPSKNTAPLDAALKSLIFYDWVVFTSVHGVEGFFERLSWLGKDARSLRGMQVACVGPATAEALRRRGVEPDACPEKFETSMIPAAIRKVSGPLRGLNILLPRTDIAPEILEKLFKREGAAVTRVEAYRTVKAKIDPATRRGFLRYPPHYLTFTSASTATNLAAMIGKNNFKKLTSKSRVVSIGPVTSKTLRSLGARVACQATQYDIDGLVAAIERDAKGRK